MNVSRRSGARSMDMTSQIVTPRNATAEVKADEKAAQVVDSLNARSVSVFDPTTHHPPQIDQFGYNKETHKGRELLNRNAKNVLTKEVRVP